MSSQRIYNKFRAAGLSHAGACGMLGNLMAESSLISNIAQRGMTKLTDAQYTEKFDMAPEACYRDGVGYGLAQWTFWTRKKALSEYAKSRGVSVGDEKMQADFAVEELRKDYPALFSFLCTTDDLYAATDRVCREYEQPAVNNVDRRYEFAKIFDRDLEVEQVGGPFVPPDLSILVLQAVLVGNGYNVEITGYNTEAFYAKLKEFVADLGRIG